MVMVRYQPRYTEVLINLMENEQTKPLINNALSTYPLYVSTSQHEYGIPNIIPTREELNKKILNYYKYREIGFETVGRFLDELEISMNEIMPYYNQLFFSADQDYNIIYNVDYRKTIDRERNETNELEAERELEGSNNVTNSSQAQNTSTTTSESSSDVSDSSTSSGTTQTANKNVRSDTPQGQLSISNVNIDTVTYGSEASWNKENGTSSGTASGTSSTESEGTSTTSDSGTTSGTSRGTNTGSETSSTTGETQDVENIVETTKGNFGVVSAQDLIRKYREIIINIEQQIINDPRITELFMLVY